jgi:hypothetical protein
VRRLIADGIGLEDMDGAYYQAFPLLLSACLNGNVTPAEQNGGEGDYLWTFTAPQTGAEDLDSFTLEVGDDVQAYEVPYCLVRSLTFVGDCVSGEAHVSADVFGHFVSQTTITGAIAIPTVEMCVGKLSRIWVDNTWAGLGGTEIANCLVNWEVTISGGAHPKFWGAANRYFTSHQQGAVTAEATFTFERNAAVAAEELLYRPAAGGVARTNRFVQLVMTGAQIGAGEVSSLTFDIAGQWTSWQTFGSEEEGNTLDVATLTCGYDLTGVQGLQVLVSTTTASI